MTACRRLDRLLSTQSRHRPGQVERPEADGRRVEQRMAALGPGARQSLVDGAPLEVVSELMGHASIDTTSIYSTQELARKIGAMRLKPARGASLPQTSGLV